MIQVKVQRCLSPVDGPWLIYDERKTFVAQVPSEAGGQKMNDIVDGADRAYFEAVVENDGSITLTQRIDDQPW